MLDVAQQPFSAERYGPTSNRQNIDAIGIVRRTFWHYINEVNE